VFVPHHEHSDIAEEACGDDQQHHRPGKPEAQVPKDKPSQMETDRRYRKHQDEAVRYI